jgi:hypothetical protein
MKNKLIVIILLITILMTIIISRSSSSDKRQKEKINKIYNEINNDYNRNEINNTALPLIEDNSKYIELQTKDWIEKRNELGYCYGLLEKDKIVMAKWMQKFNIKSPKIHYYGYHNEFNFTKLKKVAKDNPGQRFIIKITHLQSNYGIIIMPPYSEHNRDEYLLNIYSKCLDKFKTCFVCNHDNDTAPKPHEINKREKSSHYELYETIEPGIIIQDFFYSKKNNKPERPKEFKMLVYGNKIIKGAEGDIKREKNIYEMARNISKILGSSLIRVDMFVKEEDNPYIPYLNEISLSPNGGFGTGNIKKETLDKYIEEVKNYKPINMEINELIKSSPKRTIPIEKYLTDGDWGIWWKEKFRFGLIK